MRDATNASDLTGLSGVGYCLDVLLVFITIPTIFMTIAKRNEYINLRTERGYFISNCPIYTAIISRNVNRDADWECLKNSNTYETYNIAKIAPAPRYL